MKRIALWFLASSISLVAQTPQTSLPPAANTKVDYEKDVKPILAQNCYSCHGDAVQQSGLRLDLRQNALRGGDYGPVIIPGKSAESKLIKRVVDGDGAMQSAEWSTVTRRHWYSSRMDRSGRRVPHDDRRSATKAHRSQLPS
jgi:mono/diheme cytochrome c family protein